MRAFRAPFEVEIYQRCGLVACMSWHILSNMICRSQIAEMREINTVKRYRPKEKHVTRRCKYARHYHKTNTITFTFLSAITRAKSHCSSAIITYVILFDHVTYSFIGVQFRPMIEYITCTNKLILPIVVQGSWNMARPIAEIFVIIILHLIRASNILRAFFFHWMTLHSHQLGCLIAKYIQHHRECLETSSICW